VKQGSTYMHMTKRKKMLQEKSAAYKGQCW